ncbi:MAG: beta strand repeat-containing protein, partial [Bacteroidia bacterium]
MILLGGFSVKAQTTLISPTGDGGFETGATPALNGWTAVNSSTDGWYAGNVPTASAGTRCGYISATTGAAWTYSQISTIQHLYYDVTIPVGESKITLSFKWKVGGEGTTTSDWDNMKVFFGLSSLVGTPTANSAVSSTYQVSGAGAISGMYKLSSATYNTETITLTGTPGQTYRLVFSWKSDSSTIANPPAAIDEVSLISSAPINYVSNATTGNWSNSATWSPAGIPSSTDNVTIADGHTITIDATATATCNNLTVGQGTSGNLIFNSTAARTITVGGNLSIASGGTFQSASSGSVTTHALSIAGNITNNGTLDFSTNTNGAAAVITFTGAANQLVSGTGATTDLYSITMSKSALANLVDFNLSNFSVRGLSSSATGGLLSGSGTGTIKFSGTNTFSGTLFSTAAYSIPSTLGFWLNNPNFLVQGQTGSPTLSGLLRISNGIFTIGTTNNSMGFSSGANIIIEGSGIVNAVARFGVGSAGNNITYNQSGGTVYVNTANGNSSSTLASFDAGTSTSTSFNMSGGSIVVRGAASATNGEYRGPVTGATVNITGGTLQLGTAAVTTPAIAATPASTTFRTYTGVTPSIVLNATNNPGISLGGAMEVRGDLTLNGTGTFTNNSNTLTMRGNSVTNPGNITISNAPSVFTINSSNTTAFSFTSSFGNQSITNNGTITGNQLPSLTINNTFAGGTVTIPAGLSLMGGSTLTLTSGVLTVGGAGDITFIQSGAVTQSFAMSRTNGSLSATTSSFGVATPTTLNYTYGTSTAAQTTGAELPNSVGTTTPLTTLTINNAQGTILNKPVNTNTLTLTAGQLTTTDTNLVTVTGTTTGSVSRSSGYVNGPIARTLPANNTTGTYIFPVGKGTYNPFELLSPNTT